VLSPETIGEGILGKAHVGADPPGQP